MKFERSSKERPQSENKKRNLRLYTSINAYDFSPQIPQGHLQSAIKFEKQKSRYYFLSFNYLLLKEFLLLIQDLDLMKIDFHIWIVPVKF
jgi:hypothetical protein